MPSSHSPATTSFVLAPNNPQSVASATRPSAITGHPPGHVHVQIPSDRRIRPSSLTKPEFPFLSRSSRAFSDTDGRAQPLSGHRHLEHDSDSPVLGIPYPPSPVTTTSDSMLSSPSSVDAFFSSLESRGFVWSKDALNRLLAEAGLP